MKVKELIEQLKQFDGELEIGVFDLHCDNQFPIEGVSPYDSDSKPDDEVNPLTITIKTYGG